VFVINHRSNADFVVLSYGLLRHVALSYAVGEWALVWPLDVLFRAFGSYFVRRGEKDPLYHKVLERYVQVLVGEGGVTGFFIEGKLSRDGRLGAPKAGLRPSSGQAHAADAVLACSGQTTDRARTRRLGWAGSVAPGLRRSRTSSYGSTPDSDLGLRVAICIATSTATRP
jgi:hypothetical protein